MFFGLTNFPATFQIMMYKILWDLINTSEVASFIDDMIVGTKREKWYDKIVQKVIKRQMEKDLYVKLEKYKWKVREIEFLRVVIELDRIKIEKEKIKRVLDWLTFQEINNIQKFLGPAIYYWKFIKDFISIARLLYDLVKK